MSQSSPQTAATGQYSTSAAVDHERLDRCNVFVLTAQLLAWAGCLFALSRIGPSWPALPITAFFCLMMQGVFSMMHESFHDHAHRSPRLNAFMGWLASTLFGASATFIRINHLGHHVRNRTRAELVDYVEADESRMKKTLAYYSGVLGGIWIGAFVGSILLLLVPARWMQRLQSLGENNTYAAAFADFEPAHFRRIRLEVAGAAVFWVSAWFALGLTPWAVVVAYACFALSWSSLQWIYHVRTPLDVVEGAYNLRASWPIQALFLNFNFNLTHHRRPTLRWQQLPAASDPRETRPFWYGWLTILRPPQPMPADRLIPKSYF